MEPERSARAVHFNNAHSDAFHVLLPQAHCHCPCSCYYFFCSVCPNPVRKSTCLKALCNLNCWHPKHPPYCPSNNPAPRGDPPIYSILLPADATLPTPDDRMSNPNKWPFHNPVGTPRLNSSKHLPTTNPAPSANAPPPPQPTSDDISNWPPPEISDNLIPPPSGAFHVKPARRKKGGKYVVPHPPSLRFKNQ